EGLIEELKNTITAKLREAQVPVLEIDGRIKRLYSINQKLKRQKIELEQVYDFIALRIVTEGVKDCYAALGIIHQTWSPVPGRIKDFIAMPRPNGYQSLHTSVISHDGMPFEVQIRTIEMHRRAEEGIAAHLKYKEGRTDVGRQCVGARVNGKMVPLRSRLKNGDIVEIITSAGHKPSRDWLNFVVTSHARYEIKHFIRVEEKARARDLGRKVFEKEARRY